MFVDPALREIAKVMYWELKGNQLEVVLVPSIHHANGRKIRQPISHNPEWYQEFCSHFTAHRTKPRQRQKHDTLIKRQHTLRALLEIADGRCETLYADRLIPYVEDYYAAMCKRYNQPNKFSQNGKGKETHDQPIPAF